VTTAAPPFIAFVTATEPPADDDAARRFTRSVLPKALR
jgi:hypothetical protein